MNWVGNRNRRVNFVQSPHSSPLPGKLPWPFAFQRAFRCTRIRRHFITVRQGQCKWECGLIPPDHWVYLPTSPAQISADLHAFQELVNAALILQAHDHGIGGHHSQVAALVLEERGLTSVRAKQLQVLHLQIQSPRFLIFTLKLQHSTTVSKLFNAQKLTS